jgi:hypothetical protein
MGRKFSENTEFISREDRAASGKLRRDIVATKRTFTMAYDMISDVDLSIFDTLIRHFSNLVLKLEITYNNVDGNVDEKYRVETYDVIMEPFNRERVLCLNGGLWRNVSITFREV